MQSPLHHQPAGESHLKMASSTHQQNAEPETQRPARARINGTASGLNRIEIDF
jgi:hypothetical protein